jgi:transcription elongation factor GreA-like protein
MKDLTCRCKLTTTDLRNALKVDIIEAVECLHTWIKLGIVKDLKRVAEELVEGILTETEEAEDIME